MTKEEKKKLKKIPAKEIRQLYANLVDDIRHGKIETANQIYLIGWTDGYAVGRREHSKFYSDILKTTSSKQNA
jgi:hypothetical protein